jgi:hypothetical protein
VTQPIASEDAGVSAAQHIQMEAETAYALYRSNGEMTPDAILARLAQAYVRASDDMDALKAGSTGSNEARKSELIRQVFGTAGVQGDPASLAMSARDAAERVAQVDVSDVHGALALLQRAEMIGDEVLARAVAAAAYGNPLGSWGQVLDQFIQSRPAAARALSELAQLEQSADPFSSLNFNRNWGFVLQTPAELAGMADWQIRALAAGAPQ